MGFFKKIFGGIKKVFRKVGNFIKKQVNRIGKFFNKLGVVGTVALAVIAPYALPALTSFAGAAAASGNALVSGFGKFLGAGLKVASGAGKVLGSVGKAVSNTFSRVVGKVGGEFLNKIGIKNFMGQDLTKLDNWSTIWDKTQADFAGVKNAWSTSTQAFQEKFDIAKANKQAESRSLLDVDQIGGSTEMAVRESAYTDPTRFAEQGDLLSGPYSPVEQGNYVKDPITGELTVKPAMTPVAKVDPITGERYFEDALNPTVQGEEGRSLLMPDYQGASNIKTISKPKQVEGMMFNAPEKTEVATAPSTMLAASETTGGVMGGIGEKLITKGKEKLVGVLDEKVDSLIYGEDDGQDTTTGRATTYIADTSPAPVVQSGTPVQGLGRIETPISNWSRGIAEFMAIETGFRVDFGGTQRV